MPGNPRESTGPVVPAESDPRRRLTEPSAPGELMDENDHPKGALLFILVYLFLLALLWTNAYLRLWKGWGGA